MATERVLPDTSSWILVLRPEPPVALKKRLEHLLKENSVVIMPIVKAELLGGVRTEKEFNRLKTRLNALEELKVTDIVWEEASVLAFNLKRKGVTVPYTDIFIAAIAIHYNAHLLHADKHFDLIARHDRLKAENVLS